MSAKGGAMSASREAILDALRAARIPAVPRPAPPSSRPVGPDDLVAALEASVEAAGGRVARCGDEEAALAAALGEIPGFAGARGLWSAVPEIASRGVGAVHAPRAADLADLDFALLPGEVAVAESGAVWNVPAPLDRAAALLCDHLVLVVPRHAIAPTLHQAYARMAQTASAFGWFVAGPSKTADIEQALVLGAHGPRALTLVLRGEERDRGRC